MVKPKTSAKSAKFEIKTTILTDQDVKPCKMFFVIIIIIKICKISHERISSIFIFCKRKFYVVLRRNPQTFNANNLA